MVYEARKQSMAWMETDYSKHTHFRWKIKWRLEHLGALGIIDETTGESSHNCDPGAHLDSRGFSVPSPVFLPQETNYSLFYLAEHAVGYLAV